MNLVIICKDYEECEECKECKDCEQCKEYEESRNYYDYDREYLETVCPSCEKTTDCGLSFDDSHYTTHPVFRCPECRFLGVLGPSSSVKRDGNKFTVPFEMILRASFDPLPYIYPNYTEKDVEFVSKVLKVYLESDLVNLIITYVYPKMTVAVACGEVCEKIRKDEDIDDFLLKYNQRYMAGFGDDEKMNLGFIVDSYNACTPREPYPKEIEDLDIYYSELVVMLETCNKTVVIWSD